MITQKIIARTDSLKLDKIISRYGEDSMRQVVFIIVRPEPDSEDLIPITIPEDAVGSFRILKPSGNFVIVPMSKSVLASGETAFDVVIPASANTAKGSGYYDIRITSTTDKYYFTAQGDFLIDDNIISDEVLEDVSEVNGLVFPDDFLTTEDHVAIIDDDSISTDTTWSSDKINEEIEAHAGGDVSKTVSGNPVIFTDGASAPLVKCVTQITGYQQGSGTPSPDNIRPIVAYTEGEIEVSGKNLFGFNKTFIDKTADYRATPSQRINIVGNSDNSITCSYNNGKWSFGYLEFKGIDGTQDYAISFKVKDNNTSFTPSIRIGTESDSTKLVIVVSGGNGNTSATTSEHFTVYDLQVERGTTETVYVPFVAFTTHTTTYPSAIYRGSEDVVNGEVIADRVKVVFDGSENWELNNTYPSQFAVNIENLNVKLINMAYAYFAISNIYNKNDVGGASRLNGDFTLYIGTWNGATHTWLAVRDDRFATEADFKTWLSSNPLEIAYEPYILTTSSVTPTNLPIKSLSGYTHIESSTGDMEVEYITEEFQPLVDIIEESEENHEYSTTAKKVGTWIDGRNVYEYVKPISISIPASGSTTDVSLSEVPSSASILSVSAINNNVGWGSGGLNQCIPCFCMQLNGYPNVGIAQFSPWAFSCTHLIIQYIAN